MPKPPRAKMPARRADEMMESSLADEIEEAAERVRVFLKVGGLGLTSSALTSSGCISCDEFTNTAWPLDYEGARSGPEVTFDAVFESDTPESTLYPEVVDSLVGDFVKAPHGVAALLCHGQVQAEKSLLMFGETGTKTPAFTPRLPGPGQMTTGSRGGLVLQAFRALFSQLQMTQMKARSVDGETAPSQAPPSDVRMGCAMLHMELLKDLLSPQSNVHVAESERDGPQLAGLHMQARVVVTFAIRSNGLGGAWIRSSGRCVCGGGGAGGVEWVRSGLECTMRARDSLL